MYVFELLVERRGVPSCRIFAEDRERTCVSDWGRIGVTGTLSSLHDSSLTFLNIRYQWGFFSVNFKYQTESPPIALIAII